MSVKYFAVGLISATLLAAPAVVFAQDPPSAPVPYSQMSSDSDAAAASTSEKSAKADRKMAHKMRAKAKHLAKKAEHHAKKAEADAAKAEKDSGATPTPPAPQ